MNQNVHLWTNGWLPFFRCLLNLEQFSLLWGESALLFGNVLHTELLCCSTSLLLCPVFQRPISSCRRRADVGWNRQPVFFGGRALCQRHTQGLLADWDERVRKCVCGFNLWGIGTVYAGLEFFQFIFFVSSNIVGHYKWIKALKEEFNLFKIIGFVANSPSGGKYEQVSGRGAFPVRSK